MSGADDSDTFRREARAWLEANFPPSLAGDADQGLEVMMEGRAPSPDHRLWTARMGAKGWGVPTWPQAYGGGGLTAAEAGVLAEEMARLGAHNPIVGMAVNNVGPILLELGTEDQRRRHVPSIARGERRWCQGYSEPGAGSDLASLTTRCEDAGDHWTINGQKIWTSGAHHADWCFCLVRTDPSRKQDGISFVLVDMRQPGVEARPIRLIAGVSTFCETFFTDARVEKDDMVGPLNGGWAVAKRQLQFERTGQGRRRAEEGADPKALARTYAPEEPELRGRILASAMESRAHALTLRRAAEEARAGGPSAASSILKNSATRLGQEKAELAVEIMGLQGLGWGDGVVSADELATTRAWLRGKAGSIAGGTYEIQNNIIAKRILGLPDGPKGGSK